MATVSHVVKTAEESYTVYDVVEGENERYCQVLLDEGVALGEPGEPEVPLKRVSLAVPGRIVDPEMVNLDAVCGEMVEVPLEAPLWPIQLPSLPQEEEDIHERVWVEGPNGESFSYYEPELFLPPRPEAYEEPVPPPEMVARIANVTPGRLVSLVDLWVAPIHYFPAEQVLSVAQEIHLHLETETVESEIVNQVRDLAGTKRHEEVDFPPPEPDLELPYPVDNEVEFEQLDSNAVRFLLDDLGDKLGHVANPGVIGELQGVLQDGLRSKELALQPARSYWPYVIITDDNYWLPDRRTAKKVPDPLQSSTMTDEFQRLADWKSQKGVPAKVVSVEHIHKNWKTTHKSSLRVRDVPEAIREFLKYAQRTWGTKWVLLGGDIEVVPGRRIVWPQPHGYNVVRPSPMLDESNEFTADRTTGGFRLRLALNEAQPACPAPKGRYRIFCYDRNIGGQIFPDPAEAHGEWTSVRGNRKLVYLGGDRVLDWKPASGQYRVWVYDRNRRGTSDPLPGSPEVSGRWGSIRSGHKLIYLGGDRVLDWEPESGKFRIWVYDRNRRGADDPLPGRSGEVSGQWNDIRIGHELVYLEGDRVLDWQPETGEYRIWVYDRTIRGSGQNPFTRVEVSGRWQTIRSGHELIYLGGDRVLDWVPHTGKYRVWSYDRTVRGQGADPLPVLHTELDWQDDICSGHELVYLGSDRVLDWEPDARDADIPLVNETQPVFFSETTHRKFDYQSSPGPQSDGSFVEGWCYAQDRRFLSHWTKWPTRFIELFTKDRAETKGCLFFADPINRWCLPITDTYYSSLLGYEYQKAERQGLHDWDVSNFGYYGLGEVKSKTRPEYPNVGGVHWDRFDLIVGRAPALDVPQARSFVDRVIAVDSLRQPNGQQIGTAFTEGLLLFAGFENHRNDASGSVDPYAVRAGQVHHTLLDQKSGIKPGSVRRFYSDATDYGNSANWGVRDRTRWPNSPPPVAETRQGVINAWNDGFGHISVQAHGGTQGTGRSFLWRNMLAQLNNDREYGVAYVYSCSTAHFDNYQSALESGHKQYSTRHRTGDYWSEPCVAEDFVTRAQRGVAAYIGMSRSCWMDHELQKLFWRTGLQQIQWGETPKLGEMFASVGGFIRGKPNMWTRSARTLLQLFGDPEMSVWLGYTQKMMLFASASVRSYGKVHIDVRDSQGNGFGTCRICLWQKGVAPQIVYPNSLGTVDVQMKGVVPGTTIYVTVTGALHRPAFAEIKVV